MAPIENHGGEILGFLKYLLQTPGFMMETWLPVWKAEHTKLNTEGEEEEDEEEEVVEEAEKEGMRAYQFGQSYNTFKTGGK